MLPSSTEAELLSGVKGAEAACQALLAGGVEVVALKRGEAGCTIFTESQTVSVPGYQVDAVDPTGAGDCFDAGFVVGLTEDLPLEEIGRLANACGALGTTRKGPMEGAAPRAEAFKLAELKGKL